MMIIGSTKPSARRVISSTRTMSAVPKMRSSQWGSPWRNACSDTSKPKAVSPLHESARKSAAATPTTANTQS